MHALTYAARPAFVCLAVSLTLFFSCKKSNSDGDNSEQNKFITEGVEFYKYPDPPADKPYSYSTPHYVFADSKGYVWVAYSFIGEKAALLRFKDGQWDRFYDANTDVPWQSFVHSIAEGQQGDLYFLTMNSDFGNRYLLRYRDVHGSHGRFRAPFRDMLSLSIK